MSKSGSKDDITKPTTLDLPTSPGILQAHESPRPRKNSRVHFDAVSGEVTTEYIPVGNEVWEEFENETLSPPPPPKSHGDGDKIEETSLNDRPNENLEKDDYLANFHEESISSDEAGETDVMLPDNGVALTSSHVFSSFSPTSPVIGTAFFVKLDEQQKLLFNAVEQNDLEKVRGLICGEGPTGPDVNGINQQRRSPLIVAIRSKHLGKSIG